ncbi:unnamed protein product [Protopolystoma xenopodis]|uniref:Uncharacterized protein n=1 Tax=Protopolystoma xenopodis TaxID=117903 RepID=A0A3S5CPP0_9PLAT|nr:unnamed protein product [Protopolystoma xenopodis]
MSCASETCLLNCIRLPKVVRTNRTVSTNLNFPASGLLRSALSRQNLGGKRDPITIICSTRNSQFTVNKRMLEMGFVRIPTSPIHRSVALFRHPCFLQVYAITVNVCTAPKLSNLRYDLFALPDQSSVDE